MLSMEFVGTERRIHAARRIEADLSWAELGWASRGTDAVPRLGGDSFMAWMRLQLKILRTPRGERNGVMPELQGGGLGGHPTDQRQLLLPVDDNYSCRSLARLRVV